MDNEEKARGQVTGELRIKKTQHMTTSRFESPQFIVSLRSTFLPAKEKQMINLVIHVS